MKIFGQSFNIKSLVIHAVVTALGIPILFLYWIAFAEDGSNLLASLSLLTFILLAYVFFGVVVLRETDHAPVASIFLPLLLYLPFLVLAPLFEIFEYFFMVVNPVLFILSLEIFSDLLGVSWPQDSILAIFLGVHFSAVTPSLLIFIGWRLRSGKLKAFLSSDHQGASLGMIWSQKVTEFVTNTLQKRDDSLWGLKGVLTVNNVKSLVIHMMLVATCMPFLMAINVILDEGVGILFVIGFSLLYILAGLLFLKSNEKPVILSVFAPSVLLLASLAPVALWGVISQFVGDVSILRLLLGVIASPGMMLNLLGNFIPVDSNLIFYPYGGYRSAGYLLEMLPFLATAIIPSSSLYIGLALKSKR